MFERIKKMFLNWLVVKVPISPQEQSAKGAELFSSRYFFWKEKVLEWAGDLPLTEGRVLYILCNLKLEGPSPRDPNTPTAMRFIRDIGGDSALCAGERVSLRALVREIVAGAWRCNKAHQQSAVHGKEAVDKVLDTRQLRLFS